LMENSNIRAVPVEFDTHEQVRDSFSIDGSYSVLWKSPRYPLWVSMMRTAIIHRHYDTENIKIKEVSNQYFDAVDIINTHEKIVLRDGLMEIMERDIMEYDIQDFVHARSLNNDLDMTLKVAREQRGIAIFYDGSFTMLGKENAAKRETWNKIIHIMEACEANGNVLIGLSKDSALKTINGLIIDEKVLDHYSLKNPDFTGYYLLEEGQTTGTGACFARLHTKALKWIRVDFMYTQQMSIDEILETVACYSQVNDLPGTPFPPLTAHDVAVKIRQYKDLFEQQFMTMLGKEGMSSSNIISGLTDVNGKPISGTFHDYLDNFTAVKRKKGEGAGGITPFS